MTTSYTDDLALELRLLDVPGDRIGEILAEVDAHLAETGEEPVQAFGPVKDYAAERARAAGVAVGDQSGPLLARLFHGQVLFALGCFLYSAVGAWFLFGGALAVFWERAEAPFGMPEWASIGIGVVLLAGWAVMMRRLSAAERIIDPRTGRERRRGGAGQRRRG
ncbi:hypothetical protein GCM10025789_04280 [Tessaracoccus lubricantis]|uniref:DUF1707 domain-containing protein n=1 Tax=Tessaracoccus lubricantis TaxID=545543 RepID=A0ABP9EZE8_9ACTN